MCIPHSVLYLFLVVLIRIMFFTQWRAFISWQSFSLFNYVKKKIEKKAWSVIIVSPLHCKVWTMYTRVQLKGLLNVHVTLWLNCLLSQWDASVDLSLVQISVLIPPSPPPMNLSLWITWLSRFTGSSTQVGCLSVKGNVSQYQSVRLYEVTTVFLCSK